MIAICVSILLFLDLATSTPVHIERFRNPLSAHLPEEHDVPLLDKRIVGGEPVTINNYPYQLSLQMGNSHICGASIISNRWALTSAHCVSGLSADNIRLRSGSSYTSMGGNVHPIQQGAIHGSYSSKTFDYDVAVLRVLSAFPVGTTGVAEITILQSGWTPTPGAMGWVTGWGVIDPDSDLLAVQLRAVEVPIVSPNDCRSVYGSSAVTSRMLCAGWSNGGKDSCQGDSGGALVVSNIQVGIVSWGVGCAQAGYPGVYAHVGNLRTWITAQTGV